MRKLCIFTKYSDNGPSSHYRINIFKDDLEEYFHIKSFSFWNEKYYSKYMANKKKYCLIIGIYFLINIIKRVVQLWFVASKCDVIFFQKTIIPGINILNLNFFRRKKIKLIFDIDDAVYTQKNDKSGKISQYMDIVIVGNEELKEYYSKFTTNIIVIPTIDYSPDYLKYLKYSFNKKVIIWIGSSSSIENLSIVVDVINRVVKVHPEVSFKYICNSDYGYTKRITNSEFIKWSREDVFECLADATIGIMPLYDTEFNRGKCGFKLIQYLNMKKPVVASDVGTNSKIVGRCGEVPKSAEEWVVAIERLLFDEEYYLKCITNIENTFLLEYGYDVVFNKIKDVMLEQ